MKLRDAEDGRQSWRFDESLASFPHVALFVRDALQLAVHHRSTVPPALAGDIPNLTGLVAPGVRAEAGEAWTDWWEALIGNVAQQGATQGLASDAELPRQPDQFPDPPAWPSLDARPALQQAVSATADQGFIFADRLRRTLLLRRPVPIFFPAQSVGQAAEAAAARAGVPAGSLDAQAVVLDVRGLWWTLAGQGTLLCSVELTESPELSAEALTAAFSA
jgi:hypothetical protein